MSKTPQKCRIKGAHKFYAGVKVKDKGHQGQIQKKKKEKNAQKGQKHQNKGPTKFDLAIKVKGHQGQIWKIVEKCSEWLETQK